MKIIKILSDKEIYRREFFGHIYSTRELVVNLKTDNGAIINNVTIKCDGDEYERLMKHKIVNPEDFGLTN